MNIMIDEPIPQTTRDAFDPYAFVGWLYTCVTWQDDGPPDEHDGSSPCIIALGATQLGWRFDAACRVGWRLLLENEDAGQWARTFLLPQCNKFITGCLLGETRSRAL
jgi:hypothetical protein